MKTYENVSRHVTIKTQRYSRTAVGMARQVFINRLHVGEIPVHDYGSRPASYRFMPNDCGKRCGLRTFSCPKMAELRIKLSHWK